MIVENNSLLNILIPKDNKTLKNVLLESENKSLQQMVKKDAAGTSEILKNFFEDIKNGTKSNTTIQNMLKNSSLFKDLGSFSKSVTSLLNQIEGENNLSKFKPLLESFLKNIKNLDQNSLKEQIQKSAKLCQNINQGKQTIEDTCPQRNRSQEVVRPYNSSWFSSLEKKGSRRACTVVEMNKIRRALSPWR